MITSFAAKCGCLKWAGVMLMSLAGGCFLAPDPKAGPVDDGRTSSGQSVRNQSDRTTIARKYNINDLLWVAPVQSDVPDLVTGPSNNSNASTRPDEKAKLKDRQERAEEIRKYILENVEPASWISNPRVVGSITSDPIHGSLVISQTSAAHQKIESLLDDLRKTRSRQISLEMRFVTIDDATEAKLADSLRRQLALVRHAGQTRRDIFLSNGDMSQLLKAMDNVARTNSLGTPQLTLFEDQHAAVVVQTQQAYVGDLNEVHSKDANGKDAVSYDPIVKVCTATGVVVQVTACSTADGKNVFIDLKHQAARLAALLPERFPEKWPGTVGTIQRPVTEVFTVDAACAIPDQSTLLLGTQLEIDAGDPSFNKDSPDRAASEESIKELGEQAAHHHEYLLLTPTVRKNTK